MPSESDIHRCVYSYIWAPSGLWRDEQTASVVVWERSWEEVTVFFTYTFLHVYFEVVSEEVWLLWNDSLNSSREMSLKRGAWFLNFKILSTVKDKRVAESWSTTIGDELMVVSSILINECYKCRKKFQIIANNIFQNIKYFESFSSPHLFSLWDESVNYYAF